MAKARADVYANIRDNAYFHIEREIAQGKLPPFNRLCAALRSNAVVPMGVKSWLADFVEGKIVRPQGRPPDEIDTDSKMYLLNLFAPSAVRALSEENKISKTKARVLISRAWGMSVDKIRGLEKAEREKRLVDHSNKNWVE